MILLRIKFIGILIFLTSYTYCQTDGSLDISFGLNGKVITDFGGDDCGLSVIIQTDGKIIIAGFTVDSSGIMDFAIVRYNTDGSLDNSFGTNGKVTTDFGGHDWANSVKLQNDGKIVVAGASYIDFIGADFAIARYQTDGILDTSFGINGKVITDFFGKSDEANAMAIQSDGKIVAVGRGGFYDFAIARYNTDGSLDTSFNGTGKAVIDFLTGDDWAWSTAIQSDGKIVTAGTANHGFLNYFALSRFNTNGGIDNSFGNNGIVITDFGFQNDHAQAVVIQQDEKIVVAGYSYCFPNYTFDFAIVRYNSDGDIDYTFGNNGMVRTDFGITENGYSIGIQNDQKIILAGSSGYPDSCDFALARYDTFGVLDNSFGSFGKVTTDFGGIYDICFSMVIQPDGKIIAAGSSNKNGTDDFAVAKYYCQHSGINNIYKEHNSILLYPNPSSGYFKLIVPFETKEIILYNALGILVYKTNSINQNIFELKLDITGIYFVCVTTETEIINQKLIISK